MELDWDFVKKKTLWQYEELLTKLQDMTIYYESIGKKFSDFKAVIPLDWMTGFAKILPAVVE